jgi:hypothetical protein
LLIEFKFEFEFICLCSFLKSQTPFLFHLSLPLFWPNFSRNPQGRSPTSPLFLPGLVHLRRGPLHLFHHRKPTPQLNPACPATAANPSPLTRTRNHRQVGPTCHPSPPDRARAGLESESMSAPARAFPGMARTPRPSPGLFKATAAS